MSVSLLVSLAIGCAKSSPPPPPPGAASVEPAFPTGWWATRDYAARFGPADYVVVARDGTQDRRTCTWSWKGAYWSCPERTEDLLYPLEDDLVYGVGATGRRLTRVDDPERYDKAVADLPYPEDVCPRAQACCRGLGGVCEGFDTSVYACRAGIEGLRQLAKEEGRPVPDACRD